MNEFLYSHSRLPNEEFNVISDVESSIDESIEVMPVSPEIEYFEDTTVVVSPQEQVNSSLWYLPFVGSATEFFIEKFTIPRKVIAERAGISLSYLSLITSNKKEPTLKTLTKIAHAMNEMPVEFLLLKAKQLAKEDKFLQDIKDEKRLLEPSIDKLFSEFAALYIKITNKLENS